MVRKKLNITGNVFKEAFIVLDSMVDSVVKNQPFEEILRASDTKLLEDENMKLALAITGTVLLAFTIEIKLKLLILDESGKEAKKEHDLSMLFGKLSAESQDYIRVRMCKIHHFNCAAFDDTLAKMKNQFVDWRYFHEATQNLHAEYSFLKNLLLVIELQTAICRKKSAKTVLTDSH